METTSILVVDDHEVVRQGLSAIFAEVSDLSLVGYAASGAEALKIARRVRPDVAVVDLALPDMSGLELIRELNDLYPKMDVVVFTIHADDAYVDEAFGAGARGYIVKDAPSSELIEGLRTVRRGDRYLSSTLDRSPLHDGEDGEAVPHSSFSLLTPREKQVLALIADGLKSTQISERLGIGKRTVDAHRSHITQKLGLKTVGTQTAYAIRHDLLTDLPAKKKGR